MKKVELKPYKSKRYLTYILFIGVFSLISITLQGADAPVTSLDTIINAVPGGQVTVPVKVNGFNKIGSFYLNLEYQYDKLQFVSGTPNNSLQGLWSIQDVDQGKGIHRITMSWTGGVNGVTLANGSSIVNIIFNFSSGPATLNWFNYGPYCEFADTSAKPLNDSPESSFYKAGVVSALVPSAPAIDTIIQPTYELATGSVKLSGLPLGTWTINPGAIKGTGSTYIISGLTAGKYNYTVTSDGNYTSAPSKDVVINTQPITAAEIIPLNGSDEQGLSISNYPNPFKGNTTIEYTLPYEGKVSAKLYNHLGQQLVILVDATQSAGKYSINGNFGGLSPGIYIARLKLTGKTTELSETVRLNILK